MLIFFVKTENQSSVLFMYFLIIIKCIKKYDKVYGVEVQYNLNASV